MKLEKEVEKRLLRLLGKPGEFVVAIKMALIGNRGWPDRLIILPNARVCWVELKRPDGKLSAIQKVRIKTLRSMGHDVEVFDDATEAAEWVAKRWREAVGSKRVSKRRGKVAGAKTGSVPLSGPWVGEDLHNADLIRSSAKSKEGTKGVGRRTKTASSKRVDA